MEKNENLIAPAFPPFYAQDSLGRIVVPAGVSGMNKLEFVAALLLPIYTRLELDKGGLMLNGDPITASQAAIAKAGEFFNELNTTKDEKPSFKIVE
jgi:hypothetical protein